MTNSHDALYKMVTQTEKDRVISGIVTVIQAVAGDLNSRVTQLEKDRTVTNAIAANLKSEVTQAAIARTVTGIVTAVQSIPGNLKVMVYPDIASPLAVIQPNYNLLKMMAHQTDYFNFKGQVKVTDGTNFLPTMDAVARAGFVKLTDGDDVVGGVYDYSTQKFSVATSRGAGKSSFSDEMAGSHIDIPIITPSSGKKLMIVGVITAADSEAGKLSLDFSADIVWRHYVARFKTQCGMDMNFKGVVDEPLVLNSTIAGEDEFYILVNYREID